jgi:Holliday junction resolvasome RuvABC DNA-binding subunit
LDKEHTADMSEVSVPTQVISACAALGYSFKDADSLYEGVSAIAEITLNDLIESANINVNQK